MDAETVLSFSSDYRILPIGIKEDSCNPVIEQYHNIIIAIEHIISHCKWPNAQSNMSLVECLHISFKFVLVIHMNIIPSLISY